MGQANLCSVFFILLAAFVTIDETYGSPFGNVNEGTANREGNALLQPSIKLVRKARSPNNPLDMLSLYNDIQQNQLRYRRLGYQNPFEVMDALEKNVKSGGLVHPV